MSTLEREFRYLYKRALKENDQKLANALKESALDRHGWDLDKPPV